MLQPGAANAEAVDMFTRLDAQTLRGLANTPKQPEGPFFPTRTRADEDNLLVSPKDFRRDHFSRTWTPGDWTYLGLQVVRPDATPIRGVEVFLWQADHNGRYDHPQDPRKDEFQLVPNFQYWGRATTDKDGRVDFRTVMPGAYPADTDWIRPPHFHLALRDAVGKIILVTQLYRTDNEFNDGDKILQQLSPAERALLTVDFSTVWSSRHFPKPTHPSLIPHTMLSGATRLVLPD